MSNRVEPKLNTILNPLPKENIIKPLNMRSKNFDSFPPLPTPKLQPLNKDTMKFVGLRNLPDDKKVSKKIIKKSLKKVKKYIKKKEQSFLKNISQLALYFFSFIMIFTLIMFLYKKNKK
jgi:hypothetical protein